MTWFKVDDAFGSHPKVHAIPKRHRPRVLGLWLLCGTWSARHLTDGFVPESVFTDYGGRPAEAQMLVDARAKPGGVGLWTAVDGGWQFHDWSPIQPSRGTVEQRRKARAEAGRIGGEASGRARRLKAVD